MPFRAKAKNLFKSKSRTDSTSTTSTSGSKQHEVYQPGEAMPPPKYRRAPQKEHKDKLDAFSFADAWRKRSFQSTHSPMGTRASSRRTSFMSTGRKSVGRKSMARASEDGGISSAISADTDGSKKDSISAAPVVVKLPPEPEQEGDDDVGNVGGVSRVQSREKEATLTRPKTAEEKPVNGVPRTPQRAGTARDHQPFSEQDIATAMQRSHAPEITTQS